MKKFSRFTLKIVVVQARPGIWRRLVVPGDVGLRRLHAVIQAAIGAMAGHEGFFVGCGKAIYASSTWANLPGVKAATKVPLNRLLHRPGDRLSYFCGDDEDWEH